MKVRIEATSCTSNEEFKKKYFHLLFAQGFNIKEEYRGFSIKIKTVKELMRLSYIVNNDLIIKSGKLFKVIKIYDMKENRLL